MKRSKLYLAFILALALLCSACSSTPESSEQTADTAEPASTAEETTDEEPTTDEGSTDPLIIYTPQGDAERGPWIIEQAEAALGFDVELLNAGGGELTDRLIAEKNNPQADVVLGLTQPFMYQLKAEGLFSSYTPTWAEGLPEVYKDKDAMFHSFWQTPIVIGYNPDFVANPPQSWDDLANAEYQELFFVGETAWQTTRMYLIGLLWPYYDEASGDITQEGWDNLSAVLANSYQLPADTDGWLLFKDGTLPIKLDWFGGAEMNSELNEAPIEYVIPENGTPVVAEAVAVVAGTDQEEQAQQFIDWWGDPETMGAYANEFGQAPAHPDAIALSNDEIKADAEMFTAQDIDWEVCAANLNDWLEKIELEILP